MKVSVFDQRGGIITAIANCGKPAGRHEGLWDAKRGPAGVYVAAIAFGSGPAWAGKIVIGK